MDRERADCILCPHGFTCFRKFLDSRRGREVIGCYCGLKDCNNNFGIDGGLLARKFVRVNLGKQQVPLAF